MSATASATPAPAPWPAPGETVPTAAETPDSSSVSDGPLRTLAHKAASTGLVRRARQGVPSFVEPAVSRTANTADAMLTHVDTGITAAQRTLDTQEGKALRSAAIDLWSALYVFVAMLAMAALNHAENLLHIKYDTQPETPKAHTRVVKVVKVAGCNLRARFEKREKEVVGTREADCYNNARWVAGVGLALVTCVTSALIKYNGPAKEYVVPVAERAMSVLPETPHDPSEPLVTDDTSADPLPNAESTTPGS